MFQLLVLIGQALLDLQSTILLEFWQLAGMGHSNMMIAGNLIRPE